MTDLHPDLEEGIDQIDAAFFSGNTFHFKDNLAEIEKFLGRWNREVVTIKEGHEEQKILIILAGKWTEAVENEVHLEKDKPIMHLDEMLEVAKRLVILGYINSVADDGGFALTDEGNEYVEELINGS